MAPGFYCSTLWMSFTDFLTILVPEHIRVPDALEYYGFFFFAY